MEGDAPKPDTMKDSYSQGYAFLSSLYTEHEELRKDLYSIGKGRLWVAEHSDKALAARPPVEIVDTLIDRVRGADLFICVLGGPHSTRGAYDHGTPIPVNDRLSNVSYFEIELYQAALLRKPIALFVSKGFSPQARLGKVLDILQFAFPEAWPIPMDDSEIIEKVGALLELENNNQAQGKKSPIIHYRRLVIGFDDARSKPLESNGPNREILFLDGAFEQRGSFPDKELIDSIISQITTTADHERRLARLWIAIRELMAAPYHGFRYKEFRELWNIALGSWAKAGAWYGLHGHIYMGCVAALHRMAEVREIIRQGSTAITDPSMTGHPGGPLASAYYSVAKKSYRRRNLRKALWHLERGMNEKSSDIAGLYEIRGSIHRQLGRFFKAVDDYRTTLKLREKSNAPESQIGEALSELGFGYLFLGRWFKAVDYLEKGGRLLEQTPPSGFLVRAKRKLAIAYRVTGRLVKAREVKAEAERLALNIKALDQL